MPACVHATLMPAALIVILLAGPAFVAAKCCPDGQFCDNRTYTCHERSCDQLLRLQCGVESCCSCDSRESWSECPYKLCKAEGSMCVEVPVLESGRLLTAVRCGGEFNFHVDRFDERLIGDGCKIVTSKEPGITMFDDDIQCDDDGNDLCQPVYAAPLHAPDTELSFLAQVGSLLLPPCSEADLEIDLKGECSEGIAMAATAGGVVIAVLVSLVFCLCGCLCCCCVRIMSRAENRELRHRNFQDEVSVLPGAPKPSFTPAPAPAKKDSKAKRAEDRKY
eukprot:6202540-Pleurochrysis_carterae.AAC.2